jgi:hypothetical protein
MLRSGSVWFSGEFSMKDTQEEELKAGGGYGRIKMDPRRNI